MQAKWLSNQNRLSQKATRIEKQSFDSVCVWLLFLRFLPFNFVQHPFTLRIFLIFRETITKNIRVVGFVHTIDTSSTDLYCVFDTDTTSLSITWSVKCNWLPFHQNSSKLLKIIFLFDFRLDLSLSPPQQKTVVIEFEIAPVCRADFAQGQCNCFSLF